MVLLAVSEVETVVNTVTLTDTQIKQTKPKERSCKVADSGGLYLFISTTGTKSWRYDYRFHGRRETFTIGKFPAVSLKDARDLHADCHCLCAQYSDSRGAPIARQNSQQASLKTNKPGNG